MHHRSRYDADGSRLLRREPDATALYRPNMEPRLDKTTGQVTGIRCYSHGGSLVAMRTTAGVHFLSADPHGSANWRSPSCMLTSWLPETA